MTFPLFLNWLYLVAGLVLLGIGVRALARYHRSTLWTEAVGPVPGPPQPASSSFRVRR